MVRGETWGPMPMKCEIAGCDLLVLSAGPVAAMATTSFPWRPSPLAR